VSYISNRDALGRANALGIQSTARGAPSHSPQHVVHHHRVVGDAIRLGNDLPDDTVVFVQDEHVPCGAGPEAEGYLLGVHNRA
jgi:hypothetical protein